MAIASEDGIHYPEDWEAVQPGPGHAPLSPFGQFLVDKETGKIVRVHEQLRVTVHPPERPL